MTTPARPLGSWRLAAGLLIAAVLPCAADTFAGVSLKVLDASAPPGGVFQMVVDLTEPKPIIISNGHLAPGPGHVLGVVLPGDPTAAAAAVADSSGVAVRVTSPGGSFGQNATAPLIAITLGVPASTPAGTSAPLALDASASQWIGPSGAYPEQVKNGDFVAQGSMCITDVLPGGGFLQAGSTISVIGLGFQPGAIVEIDGARISSTAFVGPTRIEVVTGAALQLDGVRVSVRNPDRQRSRYYSYLRAAALGQSARALLRATEPVYPMRRLTLGSFPAGASGLGAFAGLAVQNPGPAPAQLIFALQSASGGTVATASIALPPRTELVRDVAELFSPIVPGPDMTVTVTASSPVQMLGLRGDETDGSVAPVLPSVSP
jgi:hypothetical protein